MKKRKVEDASVFFEVLENTPQESKDFVSKLMEINHQLFLLYKERKMYQIKKLAKK